MAVVVNKRDVTLQTAASRTVPASPADSIIIVGYTGITLTRDPSFFVASGGPYAVTPERMEISAQLKGIPATQVVTWEVGRIDPVTAVFVANVGTNLILTTTPDPLIKTIEASNFPISNPPSSLDRAYGVVRAKVDYGGQTFFSNLIQVVTLS